MIKHGTLIAAFLTKSDIFLASDGRVICNETGKVDDNWSKVHKINNYVGMLTAGAYLPHLKDDIIKNCKERSLTFVDHVVKITSLVLKEIWRLNVDRFKRDGKSDEIRIFIFLAGFDQNRVSRLFYLDNLSTPIFNIQERTLFQTSNDLEIAAMSTGSGKVENPSEILFAKINNRLIFNDSVNNNLPGILYSSFNDTKDQLSKTNQRIGGHTFFSKINISSGYHDISD